jgi:hypothetical protein
MRKTNGRPKKSAKSKKSRAKKPRSSFWVQKTADQVADELGIKPLKTGRELEGLGADLWKSDEEFEEFLKGIYERRRRGY